MLLLHQLIQSVLQVTNHRVVGFFWMVSGRLWGFLATRKVLLLLLLRGFKDHLLALGVGNVRVCFLDRRVVAILHKVWVDRLRLLRHPYGLLLWWNFIVHEFLVERLLNSETEESTMRSALPALICCHY